MQKDMQVRSTSADARDKFGRVVSLITNLRSGAKNRLHARTLNQTYNYEALGCRNQDGHIEHFYGRPAIKLAEVWKNSTLAVPFQEFILTKEGQDAAAKIDGLSPVRYLDAKELQEHVVTTDSKGRLVWQKTGEPVPDREYIYVLGLGGQLLLGVKKRGTFHHSSLSGAGPIKAGGYLKVQNAAIHHVDNSSGHYYPNPPQNLNIILWLSSHGFDLDQITTEFSYVEGYNDLRTMTAKESYDLIASMLGLAPYQSYIANRTRCSTLGVEWQKKQAARPARLQPPVLLAMPESSAELFFTMMGMLRKADWPKTIENKAYVNSLASNFLFGKGVDSCKYLRFFLRSVVPLDQDTNEFLDRAIAHVADADDPYKNTARRYFETILAKNLSQTFVGDHKVELEIFQKAAQSFMPARLQATPLDHMVEIYPAFDALRKFIAEHPILGRNALNLRAQTGIYPKKDRGYNIAAKYGISYVSSAEGIMKSWMPVPASEVNPIEKINRIPDIFDIIHIDQGFSRTHSHIPYVNSVSGSTYDLITFIKHVLVPSMLQQSYHINKIQKAVDTILTAWSIIAINRGFHSFQEVSRVLEEDAIIKLFASMNLQGRLNIPSDKLLSSIYEAADYSKALISKRRAHVELLDRQV